MRMPTSSHRLIRLRYLHHAFTHLDPETRTFMTNEGVREPNIKATLRTKARILAIADQQYRIIGRLELKDRVMDFHLNGTAKFIKWLKNADGLKGRYESSDYLVGVYRRTGRTARIDELRRMKVRAHTRACSLDFDVVDRSPDTLANLMADEGAAALNEELAAKPEDYRVFRLRLIKRRSIEEIAIHLGRSVATVRRALRKELAHLRKRFGDSLNFALLAKLL